MKTLTNTKNDAVINVRVSDKVKKQSKKLFDSLGLNTTTAVNIFLKKAIEVGGIPFDVRHDECSHIPNEETIAAIKESRKDIKNRKSQDGFDNVDDLMHSLRNTKEKV